MRPQNKGYARPAPKEYDFFTGGETKTADFTIYYNIAFDNVDRVVKQLQGKTTSQKNSFLAEYLWKAHLQNKNSNGYEITPLDKRIIPELIKKVEEIRNFHSHTWHDNVVLKFGNDIKIFVEKKYNEAKAALYAEFPGALMDYEYLEQNTYKGKFNLFKSVNGEHFITLEGRIFFLSFFLTTGQMSQFLQQRTGYKRADMPQFKIKRLLYTFYCHRDGAAITDFNHTDRLIDTLDADVRDNVFKARTAFKLISYLFDYPEYWGSKDAMPLFDADGNVIKDVIQLKDYIKLKGVLPGLVLELIERKPKQFLDETADNEDIVKAQEDKHRIGTLAFSYVDLPGYFFNINFEALHRLVLLQSLFKGNESESPLSVLKNELKKQSDNREVLYNILSKPVDERTETESDYLLDKENQYLRGGRKLTELGIAFFEAMGKEKNEKGKDTLILANIIRPIYKNWIPVWDKKGNEVNETEPEPIQIFQQDFVLGTRQKFRAGNRFVFYTAKFLMDFAGDDWYWGMEKFELVKSSPNAATESLIKNKTYFKASEIPLNGDYRLTLENDHIYLALLKNPDAEANHEKYYQFAIGPNAMRYIAAFIQKNEHNYKDKLKQFLTTLSNDLNKLQNITTWNESDGYELLESVFVSSYLKQEPREIDVLRQKLYSRVSHIKEQWNDALINRQYLSRSTKNRLIMDAYRLFDWASPVRTDGKFFRANEYNQMSICHYSLHLKEPVKGKPGKFDYLFRTLFKLEKRQPPIPEEIRIILDKATSLDHLMELVFDDREFFLNNKLSVPSHLLKKELPGLCRMLGLSIPASLLKGNEQTELKEKHTITLKVQPFMIHPMLVLKYFFPDVNKAGKVMSTAKNRIGETIKVRPKITIFLDLRKNAQLNKVLHPEFYKLQIAENLYPDICQKRQQEKLSGILNTTFTEDILLWWMAQRYLANNDFTKVMGEMVKKEKDITLENLNSLKIILPLHKSEINDPIENILYTSVLMHQLDDLMFMTEKSRLRKAAVHFIKRCTTERELWRAELEKLSINQFEGNGLPYGNKDQPIPFQLLRDELELIRRNGQKVAEYIFNFEKSILQKVLNERYDSDKDKFHSWLKASFKNESDQKMHYNFESILKLDTKFINSNNEILSEYRNIAFHNDVPIGKDGSFAWLTKDGTTIRNLLSITEDINIKKDRSSYIVDIASNG